MSKIRVLHVLNHSPWYFRDPTRPMDAQSMTDDWHVRTATALHRAFPGRFALECWRPDWREPREKTVDVNGLACRIFPSRPAPLGKFSYETSLPMLRALWGKARRERFILHMHEVHSAFGVLAGLLPRNAIKTAHNHGTPPLGLRLAEGRPPAKRLALTAALPLENASLARYGHVFAISDRELSYLRGRRVPASKLTMGVDFQAFTPRDKALARQRLGLPAKAKIAFYIGRYFRLKGVDKILDAMDAVRSSLPEACLLMAGGFPQDELFEQVMARADRGMPRVPHADLPDYIAASDLCIINVAEPGLLGIGMAAVEAMAMDVPVLSSALGEFPGPAAERDRLGIWYRPGRDDLAQAVRQGLALEAGPCPREIARKYYDWPVIAAEIARVYEELWDARQ
ncbi:glycosyltransferase family 4 protein [Fundidesulfovibrio terrae]|uniref:glycosyltransferase family 4 protein n=1 Tax=Fundidesulfovibrio terrae TaxID=2922866 RepID=UPI001FAF2A49|nr:glycosyltransferase family 4 protein [Fundidesulfovibrio terrae]